MREWLFPDGFEPRLTKTEAVLGWLYLPLHAVILPLLLGLYAAVSGQASATALNLLWYGAGTVFVLCVLPRFLRRGFDAFLDAPGRCVTSMAAGLLLAYGLGIAVSALLLLLGSDLANPNNAQTTALAGRDYGVTKAMVLYLAPLVEETLFRGVAFGSLRPRGRLPAYAVSSALFCLYHVWQYAAVYADPRMLLYALQYVPHSLAFAWCYDRTGSVWTPVFLHMLLNAVAFAALNSV